MVRLELEQLASWPITASVASARSVEILNHVMELAGPSWIFRIQKNPVFTKFYIVSSISQMDRSFMLNLI